MKIHWSILFAALATSGLASAQPKAAPPAKADAVKAEPKADGKMPTPPTELVDFGKAHTGTWKCTGEMQGPAGMVKITATNKVKADLDKWWVSESFEAKGGPMPFKMQSLTTFDANAKKWRRVTFDNWGTQMVGTADAAAGGKLTFNLDMMGPMGAGQFRDHAEGGDAKTGVKMWGEMSNDKGKSWSKVYDITCKK